jgi:cyclopropane fatty-acyl-phospholipid synthase-like methyltransferase
MGHGRNAIYLAQKGFQVEGVDISTEAVADYLKAAHQAGVSIEARVADLKRDCEIKIDSYSVIICFNYLQRSLIPQMKDSLQRGGVIVYETFLVDQAQMGRPKNPDFLLEHNELLEMFRDFRVLHYREGVFEEAGKKRAIASILAQKA